MASERKELRLILGDQLNIKHSWFEEVDPQVTYLMMECRSETDYTVHHIQKIMAFFGAMRRLAEQLQQQGHQVYYYKLQDPANKQDFELQIQELIEQEGFTEVAYLYPDEYRLDEKLKAMAERLPVPVTAQDTEHFITGRYEVQHFFRNKKTYFLESFYRDMRKRYQVLMTGDGRPVGDKWNFDVQNRQKYDGAVPIPERLHFHHDLSDVYEAIQDAGVETMGRVEDPSDFRMPLDREEAMQHFDHFLENALPAFGTYQDSLVQGEGKLFHALISFTMNSKIIDPLEVVQRAEAYWQAHQDEIDIAQIEGFIRQILGWREFVRGIYWAQMPEYETFNYFNHQRPLPDFYWTGDTHMNCLSEAINNSLDNAYAHHIQRLMVTGNFALIAGIHPDEVDHWYLGVYMDAIQWAEITNTRGMSQYADGGKLATKPYASSASYIQKMSNHCEHCYYDPKKKVGERACPFNSIFWHFMEQNRDKLQNNYRMGMLYNTLDKMKNKEAILNQAEEYLANLDAL
jgi:deoxyribodipyrimidine photolyase-related protein